MTDLKFRYTAVDRAGSKFRYTHAPKPHPEYGIWQMDEGTCEYMCLDHDAKIDWQLSLKEYEDRD